MTRLCHSVALLTVLLLTARDVAAQSPEGLRALALPEGQPVVCTVPVATPTEPPQFRALVRRAFAFAAPSSAGLPPGFPVLARREVMVAWDSAGHPVMLNDRASPPLRDGTNVVALFRPSGTVVGRHLFIAVDSAEIAAAVASGDPDRAAEPALTRPPVSRDLTAEEGARARALAAWLWARRCRGAA